MYLKLVSNLRSSYLKFLQFKGYKCASILWQFFFAMFVHLYCKPSFMSGPGHIRETPKLILAFEFKVYVLSCGEIDALQLTRYLRSKWKIIACKRKLSSDYFRMSMDNAKVLDGLPQL